MGNFGDGDMLYIARFQLLGEYVFAFKSQVHFLAQINNLVMVDYYAS